MRSDRGSVSLPELLTVMVTSLIVLGAILLALATMEKVSARTSARSEGLRSLNVAMRTISKDVRSAFAVAPLDPATPGADADGVALLVQQGTTGAARDPRVWITYSCATSSARRSCLRRVFPAEASTSEGCTVAADGSCSDRTQPPMLVSGAYFGRGAMLSEQLIITDLARGGDSSKVFSLGWPADTGTNACGGAECIDWTTPAAYPNARLDPRGFYRRAPGDSRPPVVRVALQSQPPRTKNPVAVLTSLSPRGCVDPAAPATTGNQFEC